MRELAIAAVWLFFSASLFYIEPEIRGDYAVFVARGKWVALALAGVNALRPLVKWGGMAALRKLGLAPALPPAHEDFDEPPPRPVVRLDEPDDRIQAPPPPPGSFKP